MADQPRPITDADLLAAVEKILAARQGRKPARWSEAEMIRLAASGVAKVDLLGERGTTLCSMEEIAAMAAVLAMSGVLPPPHKRVFPEAYFNGDQT
jgi:hypothetical protein